MLSLFHNIKTKADKFRFLGSQNEKELRKNFPAVRTIGIDGSHALRTPLTATAAGKFSVAFEKIGKKERGDSHSAVNNTVERQHAGLSDAVLRDTFKDDPRHGKRADDVEHFLQFHCKNDSAP